MSEVISIQDWQRKKARNSWKCMKSRCTNPKNSSYKYYGPKGIKVCERWQKFVNFFEDMGPPPTKAHTLEREKNDKDYEPGNCRWATPKEQQRNTVKCRWFDVDGERLCLADTAEHAGIAASTIFSRINKLGWSEEKALSTPCQVQDVLFYFMGFGFSSSEWGRILGIALETVGVRTKRGWPDWRVFHSKRNAKTPMEPTKILELIAVRHPEAKAKSA